MTASQVIEAHGWLDVATHAYEHPGVVASEWREQGGKVVGVIGHDVPSELVAACGMLPIRLAPSRLGPPGAGRLPSGPDLRLTPDCQVLLEAIVSGGLDWIDALVIGRDSESYTKLFYVLRELVSVGIGSSVPPFWFYDLLRLPTHASARYNRFRAREFVEVLKGWSGSTVSEDEIRRAVDESNATCALMARIADLRRSRPPCLSGVTALTLVGAAATLPFPARQAMLRGLLDDPPPPLAGKRVMVSGSPQDQLGVYRAIEAEGLVVVGEDHDWGDRSSAMSIPETPNPLDGLVDRYHLGPPGSARGGLAERCRYSAGHAALVGADAVLQVVFEHDEASEWELPGVRDLLAETGVPVVPVRIAWPPADDSAIGRSVDEVLHALGGRDG
jgi:benzoyl-CoA reductase/2-hydroxyglutaryl-CoA dehydratase subunit BcrC/BadD/HgdB